MSKKKDKINRLDNTKTTQSETPEPNSGLTRRKFLNYSTFALLAAALPLSFTACGSGGGSDDGGVESTWSNNAGDSIPWSNNSNPWSNNNNPWSNNPWSNNSTPWSNNLNPWSNNVWSNRANPNDPNPWANGTNPNPGGSPWSNNTWNNNTWSNNWSNNPWNNFVNSGIKSRKS